MFIAAAYYSEGCKLDARGKPIFDSCITKFMLRSSGDLICVILVDDSNVGGPSSMTVRMEYVFVFQISYFEICVGNTRGGGRKHYFVDFCYLGCFNCR